jgi:hypothetical protein
MRTRHTRCAIAGAVIAALGATGCELFVELDRGAIDAGVDAVCPICTDDGGDGATDADGGATNLDASAEASTTDSAD